VNVVNKSSLDFSKSQYDQKFFKTSISNQFDGKSHILLTNEKIDEIKDTSYEFIVSVSTDKSNNPVLEWSTHSVDNIPVTGKAIINVDYDVYEEEKKATLSKKDIEESTIIEAIEDAYRIFKKAGNQKLVSNNLNNVKKGAVQTLSVSPSYDWTLVQTSQVASYHPPHGQIRNNTTVKKAHLENGNKDHYMSVLTQAQVNPGAQLCSTNTNYECKYQIDNDVEIEIWANPVIPHTMIDHKPTNAGSSGSVSYSIGAGYASGQGWSATAAYQWTQNWSDLTLTDNSVTNGDWYFYVSGGLQSKVVTVEASNVYIVPDDTNTQHINTTIWVEFDSWNTSPVFREGPSDTYTVNW